MFDAGVRRCLLVVAAAALVAAGCGSAENEPSIAAAVEKTESAGSSRIEMSGTESQSGATIEFHAGAGARLPRGALSIVTQQGVEKKYQGISFVASPAR